MKNKHACGSLASYVNVSGLMLPVDWNAVFGRKAPLDVEIGFGTGEYMIDIARQDPGRNFLGFEQSAERIIKTMRKISDLGLTNVKLLMIDAALAFRYLLPLKSVDKVHCLFPCPWPKKRHAKHRLFSEDFLRLVNSRLAKGGQLRLVTDHRPYVDWILERAAETGFAIDRRVIPPTFGTKFEKKWFEAGQETFDELVFRKVTDISGKNYEGGEMKTYSLKKIDPEKVEFLNLSGPVSIQFKDFIFDPKRSKGMAQAIVTEKGQTQYLWIAINRAGKGWCLSAACGSSVLPTEGVRKALELAQEAFLRSAAGAE